MQSTWRRWCGIAISLGVVLVSAIGEAGSTCSSVSDCAGSICASGAPATAQSCSKPSGCAGHWVCDQTAGNWYCDSYGAKVTCLDSECGADGYRLCTGLLNSDTLSACRPLVPRAEQCNRCDDNANGQVDEGLSGLVCTTATMCSGATQCTNGVLSCNLTAASSRSCSTCSGGTQSCNPNGTFGTCQPSSASPEFCNGCDDDKDGIVDEDTGGQACTLANGCTGQTQCSNGATSCSLIIEPSPVPPYYTSSSTRSCNGCGPNATQICLASGLFGPCRPESPRPEECNGCDDNWDSLVDEGLQRVCTSINRCSYQTCTMGTWGPCSTPPQEVCNGEDDDCDDEIDEDAVCRAPTKCTCKPVTCQSVAAECGQIPDGCGSQLDCGKCSSGLRCVANACVP